MIQIAIPVLVAILVFSCSMSPNLDEPTADVNFTYETDTFADSTLLDLRYLNETYAGEHGFIQLKYFTPNPTPIPALHSKTTLPWELYK